MTTFSAADLTVVIPTRDRWDILRNNLDALSRQTAQGFDVVVVVDGTDQKVPDVPGAHVVVKEHGGPGAARNAGVRETTRPLVLFLGDDMIPEPTLIERHLVRHDRSPEPEVVILGHVDWHPSLGRDRILSWFDWSSSQFDYKNIRGEDAGWGRFYSSNTSLKRDFFTGAGGFDEDFVFYYEDLDAGWRFNEHGMRLIYERGARALHDHRYDLERVIRRFEGIARGEYMMASKHPWFTPFFLGRAHEALTRPRASQWWTRVVDVVPESAGAVRRRAETGANDWYYQRIAPRFLNAWESARDLEELQAYLGTDYDPDLLKIGSTAVEREEEAVGDEATFYRTSRMYLYDLTAFAMTGTKVPYLQDLRRFVAKGARLLDWGCGIGTDGLRLTGAGYSVAFVDFDNPSTRYLRWRLERRGIDAPVYDVERDEIPGGFDAAYSFDVIEHIDDPFAFLEGLERRARIVAVNFLEPETGDTHLHKPLPIRSLLEHAERRGLIRYRRYHGRSHFVIYGGRGDSLGARVRSKAERLVGQALR
jgi:GT2 family glycosyltransferase/2-polyprenyl-3-methyl-5-hydroxy-6-metoxy-1,4-benzoquinol methylase